MRLRQIGAVIVGAAIAIFPIAALAAPGNSAATISGAFDDSCRDFEAHSTKDISHVQIHYVDGRVVKDESVDSHDFALDGDAGDEITSVIVKSGTTAETFGCESGPPPCAPTCAPCEDGIDNDGNGLIDYPEDPGCSGPGDNDEGFD